MLGVVMMKLILILFRLGEGYLTFATSIHLTRLLSIDLLIVGSRRHDASFFVFESF